MHRGFAALAAGMLLTIAIPAIAQAQPRNLPITGKAFEHQHSKLRLPGELLGFRMTRLIENAPDQLDVVALWDSPDNKEAISVYVYRFVLGAVPVWFDRARVAIETRADVYGSVTRLPGAMAFVPPGQSTASGLATTYATQGRFRSTGVALLPMGEWLVKVRYSSATLAPEQLAPRVQAVLAALTWPDKIGAAPAAVPIEPCATPLIFAGKANPAKQDSGSALMAALMATAEGAKDDPVKRPAAPASWCRDPALVEAGAVYRPDASASSYLIAINDAGRGVRVGPNLASAILAKDMKRDSKPSWSIGMIELARHINFPAVDRLPAPQQVIDIIKQGRYDSMVTSWGKKRDVQLHPDALK
ncbi:hypothetical protein [Sphingomonas sp. M1-B02]|uniref:hypothetical protein n=1 Tax=Sphingomonas sp. M1-B02 TaxID=3114300 RepID=UPI0022400E47|nr:hypothetical protein [Sphingomonas sp. S6-11]UZK64799.1 hypothetical protein OKW87_09655 [Sphingomonas sp. S6-11]